MHIARAGLVSCIALSSVTLTGCDSAIYQSPGAIRLSAEHVEFAVCDQISGSEIVVFGERSQGDEETTYMSATGNVVLTPGTLLSSAAAPDALDVRVWSDPVVTPGAGVALFVYDADGGVVFPIEFSIPQSGLSNTLWTRADGRTVETPCD